MDKKLAFLTNFMGHYNSLNLQLLGKEKNIIEFSSEFNNENISSNLVHTFQINSSDLEFEIIFGIYYQKKNIHY